MSMNYFCNIVLNYLLQSIVNKYSPAQCQLNMRVRVTLESLASSLITSCCLSSTTGEPKH